ncbi:LysR family transcriptional regulator [Peribacillus butanolivorans]|uniref:LysR family transcriptional regulator n=1 Tax=Peribacillus butanolivorans TaxID=421767 RepID=UPI0030C9C639
MQFEQLEAFLAVVQTKNFTKASEILHVTQSTITNRIKVLEEHLGVLLFSRNNRHVDITLAGENFKQYAYRLVELKLESEKGIRIDGKFDSFLTIGSTHFLWEYILPPAVDEFRRDHPKTALRMYTAHSIQVIQKMLDGIVDISVTFIEPNHNEIEVIPFFRNELVLVGSPSIINEENLKIEQFDSYTYLHMDWGELFNKWFIKVFGNQHPALQIDHASMFIKYLLKGEGIGFLSKSIARPLIQENKLKIIDLEVYGEIPAQQIYILFPKRKREQLETLLNYLL